MSDETQGGDAPSTAIAVRQPPPRRQITPVTDLVPIFDTARFEHYGRVASVMADASLIPKALKGESREEAVGNCFMIVELADRLNVSPYALAQSASVIHGRIMLEGKVVNAVIQAKLGIELFHYFKGEFGTDAFRVYMSDRELTEAEVEALTPKKYPRGAKMIDGSVGEWKTFEKDGRTVSAAWRNQPDMQCLYRGARVWSRVYKPGIMLGIYGEDEMDEIVERRDESQRVAGQRQLSGGFGDETDRQFSGRSQNAQERGEAAPAPGAPAQENSAPGAQEGAPAPQTDADQTIDAEFTAVEPEADAPKVDEKPAKDPKPKAEKKAAAPKEDAKAKEPEKEPEPKEPEPPAEAEGQPAFTEGAGPESVEAERQEEELEPSEFDTPADPVAEAFAATREKIMEAKDWLAEKQHLRTLGGTEAWKSATEEQKYMIRGAAWSRFAALRADGSERTDVIIDMSLFRLWLEFGAEDGDQIDGMIRTFLRQEAYRKASEGDKKAIVDLADRRKAELAQ